MKGAALGAAAERSGWGGGFSHAAVCPADRSPPSGDIPTTCGVRPTTQLAKMFGPQAGKSCGALDCVVIGHLFAVQAISFMLRCVESLSPLNALARRYDHVCKLWDARQSRCLASMDHGAPIEAVAFFPSGTGRWKAGIAHLDMPTALPTSPVPHPHAGSLLVTAGGTDLCIWHMLHSGQLLQRITAHQKTATSVVVTAMAGAEPHIMSAGLDGHVKVGAAATRLGAVARL